MNVTSLSESNLHSKEQVCVYIGITVSSQTRVKNINSHFGQNVFCKVIYFKIDIDIEIDKLVDLVDAW